MTQDMQSVLQENLHLTELLTKVRMETTYLEKKTKFCSEVIFKTIFVVVFLLIILLKAVLSSVLLKKIYAGCFILFSFFVCFEQNKIKNPKIKVLKDLKTDHGVLEQRFSKVQTKTENKSTFHVNPL